MVQTEASASRNVTLAQSQPRDAHANKDKARLFPPPICILFIIAQSGHAV